MRRTPPLAEHFTVGHIAAFDDEALATFLAPCEGGIDPTRLGAALSGPEHDELRARVASLIPGASARIRAARASADAKAKVADARRYVVERLFWPLLYWHMPGTYEELVSGEQVHPELMAAIDLDDKVVADLGAGSGRFTLAAAPRARHVIAVDEVPPLLERLAAAVAAHGYDNVEIRRGNFHRLPIDDACVDIAVACSSLGSRGPSGGGAAIAEACRVLRRGGELWLIWPDDPAFFTERGFRFVQAPPPAAVSFPSVEAAERLCRDFYGESAAGWVRDHQTAVVPYAVLGMRPPADACVLRVGVGPEEDDTRAVHPPPRPGVEVTPSR